MHKSIIYITIISAIIPTILHSMDHKLTPCTLSGEQAARLLRQLRNHHRITRRGYKFNKLYFCTQCSYVTESLCHMQRHSTTHLDPQLKSLSCRVCSGSPGNYTTCAKDYTTFAYDTMRLHFDRNHKDKLKFYKEYTKVNHNLAQEAYKQISTLYTTIINQ